MNQATAAAITLAERFARAGMSRTEAHVRAVKLCDAPARARRDVVSSAITARNAEIIASQTRLTYLFVRSGMPLDDACAAAMRVALKART